MAEDAVDKAIEVFHLTPRPLSPIPNISGLATTPEPKLDGSCQTSSIRLVGAHGYTPTLFIDLIRHFDIPADIAQHLAQNYGDRAWAILQQQQQNHDPTTQKTDPSQPLTRLSPSYPYITAEITHAIHSESACTAIDVLARRTRLSFLDARAALTALPQVIQVMGDALSWTEHRRRTEWTDGTRFLASMGLPANLVGVEMEDVIEGRLGQKAVMGGVTDVEAGKGLAAPPRREQKQTQTAAAEGQGAAALGLETASS